WPCKTLGSTLRVCSLALGGVYEVLSSSINHSWNVENLDLIVLSLKCGVSFKFNLFTLLGIIAGSVFSLRRI
ncbi:MAG: DUF4321 domain-containing protein, partial [Candidatus Omnitrophica bacterium]|nr:DUF4321 domain-containing protein [Candidatus Omnitrophota bacterium]